MISYNINTERLIPIANANMMLSINNSTVTNMNMFMVSSTNDQQGSHLFANTMSDGLPNEVVVIENDGDRPRVITVLASSRDREENTWFVNDTPNGTIIQYLNSKSPAYSYYWYVDSNSNVRLTPNQSEASLFDAQRFTMYTIRYGFGTNMHVAQGPSIPNVHYGVAQLIVSTNLNSAYIFEIDRVL